MIFFLIRQSSEEIIERTKKEEAEYYLPKIDQLSSKVNDLSSQIIYLKSLLTQNGIPFNLESEPNDFWHHSGDFRYMATNL